MREVTMKVLVLATAGAGDPTRASIPLHIAANGSLEAGQDVAVVLAGDATELVSEDTANGVEGVGVPPARDLFAKLVEHDVPIHI
jgi:predicted peroxiredoxin